MGLRASEFWAMTWAEFNLASRAHIYKEEMQWVHTRYQVAMLLNVHRKPKTKPIKPEELIELSFDKKRKQRKKVEIIRYTREEILEMKRIDGIGLPQSKKEFNLKAFKHR